MRAMRFWSALSTITSLSSWRLRLVALEVRMWRFIEWPRLILPVAVFLKRFAAPLWVFIFGITSFHYNINGAYSASGDVFTTLRLRSGQAPTQRAQENLWCTESHDECRSVEIKTNSGYCAAYSITAAVAAGVPLAEPRPCPAWARVACQPLAAWRGFVLSVAPGSDAACCLPAAAETPRSPCRPNP